MTKKLFYNRDSPHFFSLSIASDYSEHRTKGFVNDYTAIVPFIIIPLLIFIVTVIRNALKEKVNE